jgi:hypothetical protein
LTRQQSTPNENVLEAAALLPRVLLDYPALAFDPTLEVSVWWSSRP